MKKESKIWGTTIEIVKNPFCELHRAEIKKGGNCSIHIHQFKINGFYVESGELEIHCFRDNGIVDITILRAGDYLECKPNEKHKFRALEDTIVYEIYFPQQIGDIDIKRDNIGYME